MPPRVRSYSITLLALTFVVSACEAVDDGPVAPTRPSASALSLLAETEVAEDGRIPDFPTLVDDVMPVQVDLEGAYWLNVDDLTLEEGVRASKGRVHVGLRPAGAAKSGISGVLPGLAKTEALPLRDQLAANGVQIFRSYRHSATVAAIVAPEAVAAIRRLPFVDFVEPIPTVRLAAQDTTWGVTKIGAPVAWGAGYDGDGVMVTILDSGIDFEHAYYSAGDGPTTFLNCLYVSSGPFSNCYDGSLYHGTHVAGIIAGENNSYGVVGVAHGLRSFNSVKVCNPSNGICWADEVVGGLDWTTSVASSGRQIVNMSLFVDDSVFAGGTSPNYVAVAEAVARSYDAGNLLVASAGNNSGSLIRYPAAYSQVISVSGTTPADGFASGYSCQQGGTNSSGWHSTVELSAPFDAYSLRDHPSVSYQWLCGTSMSAAFVTGAAALVWDKYPTWTNAQVRSRLTSTAKDLGATGRDQFFGYGQVDASAALGLSLQPPSVGILGPNEVPTFSTCTWQADITSGGTPPYSYQWRKNGATVGSASFVSISTGGSSFSLDLIVTDAASKQGFASLWVTVDPDAEECLE